ncbi:MAG: transposase [Deltaproteobacteria bacterium]|nr:transposase [Deltaproteobacteria bacterium]
MGDEPGATVATDGRQGYDGLAKLGYDHLPVVTAGHPEAIEASLPMVHIIASNLKSWLLGIGADAGAPNYEQLYSGEWVHPNPAYALGENPSIATTAADPSARAGLRPRAGPSRTGVRSGPALRARSAGAAPRPVGRHRRPAGSLSCCASCWGSVGARRRPGAGAVRSAPRNAGRRCVRTAGRHRGAGRSTRRHVRLDAGGVRRPDRRLRGRQRRDRALHAGPRVV